MTWIEISIISIFALTLLSVICASIIVRRKYSVHFAECSLNKYKPGHNETFYRSLYDGDLKSVLELMINLKSMKNKMLLNFSYKSVLRESKETLGIIEKLLWRNIFNLLRYKYEDKQELMMKISALIVQYNSDELLFIHKVLFSNNGLRLVFKQCVKKANQIETWEDFILAWDGDKCGSDEQELLRDEEYFVIAVMLYHKYHKANSWFKEKLEEFFSKQNEIDEDRFLKMIYRVDKYLNKSGKLALKIYDSVYEPSPAKQFKVTSEECINELQDIDYYDEDVQVEFEDETVSHSVLEIDTEVEEDPAAIKSDKLDDKSAESKAFDKKIG